MIYTKKRVEQILKDIYRKRDPWTHKRKNGVVLVVAGSYQFSGSPIFSCMSAYRAGADLVMLVTPRRSADIAASYSPDLIAYAREKRFLDSDDVDFILGIADECDSVLIGPGLSQDPETRKMVLKLINRLRKPMVIDADAIRFIGRNHRVLHDKKFIITPHLNEFLALTGMNAKFDTADRKSKVSDAAKRIGGTIILKGKDDVVADSKNIYVNQTGSPFMTKGGFGDCLAGICAQFLAKGLSPFDAACAAVYLNGLAGEIAAGRYQDSVIASDMFFSIPEAVAEIKKRR
ncbi:NAD(P)H-hydrate dehydratase [Candidatus Woesearchaeota archaeon]|nr:NAD(P)H-hydrate dehydratase [Candidatus Woesearchaeota archaeon]